MNALLSLQFAVLVSASAAAFASPPLYGPTDPKAPDHWVRISTAEDVDDAAPELQGALVYIDSDEMSYVGDGSKDDGYPVNVNLWLILKSPADGPQGRYTEVNDRTFVLCDTKKLMNTHELTFYAADGSNLGTTNVQDPKQQYSRILLGSVGNKIYDYACAQRRAR